MRKRTAWQLYNVLYTLGRMCAIEIMMSLAIMWLFEGSVSYTPQWFLVQGIVFAVGVITLLAASGLALVKKL